MVGVIPGSVTCQACRSLPAPSEYAASYSSGFMLDSAPR